MRKYWYNWEEMRKDVNALCREIILDKFDPEVIVGLSRGGHARSHDVALVPQAFQTDQDIATRFS